MSWTKHVHHDAICAQSADYDDSDAPDRDYFRYMNESESNEDYDRLLDALGATGEHIEPLNMDGTDPEFERFQDSTEHDLIQSAHDLRQCGWSVERIVERVMRELQAA